VNGRNDCKLNETNQSESTYKYMSEWMKESLLSD